MNCFWCQGKNNAAWRCFHCKTWLCDSCAERHFKDMPNMEKIAELDKKLVDAEMWNRNIQDRLFEAEDKISTLKELLREFLYVEYCQWCNMDVEAHLAMKRDEPATYQHYMKVYGVVHGEKALKELFGNI